MRPGGPSLSPAGLDRRFYAFALDRLVAWTLEAVAAVAAYSLTADGGHVAARFVLAVLAVLLVEVGLALVAGLWGTSPGRAASGLRVVRPGTGTPIGAGPAVLRALVLALATLPTCGLGVALLARTAVTDRSGRRRGWHDHLAGSFVVDARPVPAAVEHRAEAPLQIVNLTAMRLVPAPQPEPAVVPAPPARSPVPPPAPPTRWRVAVDTGESLVVEGLALVGRAPEARAGERPCHLVALASPDLSLSKTHAQLQVAPDGVLVVMDRGSTNGSVLVRGAMSRQLAAGRPATLIAGDRVRLGDRELVVTREA